MTGGGAAPPVDEVERLRRDLRQAHQQLAATSEVLTTLGHSTVDLDGVLETVVESARRLCRADVAQVHLIEESLCRLACSSGLSDEGVDYMARHPVGLDRASLIGRVGLYGRTQQIVDVLADPDYGRFDLQRIAGLRTVLGVPMVLDGGLVGVLLVWRTEVVPFGDRETDVLLTFAAQAAVAIRQIDLVRTLGRRQDELARKVEHLEALREIGQVVSSSLDPDEVLVSIITHAVQLSGTDGGSIFEFDDVEERFRVRAAYGTSDELVDALRNAHIGLHDTLVGRTVKEGRSRQVADLRTEPSDAHLRCLEEEGWRSVIAVPLIREDRILGAMVVRRLVTGPFSDDIRDLLSTFASQSALALVNAELFRELEQKSAELEVASRHKSEFLASMSHELRTPLNAVIGFSEVLLAGMFGDINERQEEYLRDIWASGKHLLELLNDILDLSKVEAGRMELDLSPFPLQEGLEYGMSLVRERAASHGIALSLDVSPEVGLVQADGLRLKQVVLNLLSNAVKFTGDGGHVRVQARRDGDEVVVMVTDTGSGVAPEDATRIFEAFQQGGRGRAKVEGTGLGLTLCKQIVELHGGRMWVDSELGRGSTFGFALPVTEKGAAGAPVAQLAPSASGLRTIVIVEDDRRSLELLTLYIEGPGVTIVTARDGREGLDVIRRLHPAAVVLDIQLPGLDGWDLLALLKADPQTSPIPVVVVSMVDERGKGFALGADEYLVKPVGRDDVRTALARVTALPGTKRTVVAIDDDPLALELVRAVLEPEGWTVLSARSGAEGIALTKSQQPAVVLLDLLMPGMDGFAVVDALRAEPETASVPIIVLTSKTMTNEDKARLQDQISCVARKGEFGPTTLSTLVRRVTTIATTSEPEAT